MSQHRGQRPRSSHRFFKLTAVIALLGGFLYWSNHSLQVEDFVFSSPRLPEGFDGTVIVQLTDLHGAYFGDHNEKLYSAVRELCPDYIVLTGDILDSYQGTPHAYAGELCRDLAQIAPTYVVTGNHEWALPDPRGLKRRIRESGATLLDNRFLTLDRHGDSIVLAGIDDPNGFADQKTPEALAEEVRDAFGDPFWILLAHRNDRFASQYSYLGADLVMAGHGHGGIIRLPFTDGLISHKELFPSYTAGFYEENGSTLFVSRGLGNSGISFRLFNRPQIAVLTLRRDTSPS